MDSIKCNLIQVLISWIFSVSRSNCPLHRNRFVWIHSPIVTNFDCFFLFTPAHNGISHTAIHNYPGQVEHGLPLDIGDSVEILEECEKWYRGTCSRRPRAIGIFPKTYIHLKDVSKIDPVVAECTQVLREWSEISKRVFVKHANLVSLSGKT